MEDGWADPKNGYFSASNNISAPSTQYLKTLNDTKLGRYYELQYLSYDNQGHTILIIHKTPAKKADDNK